MNPLQHLSLNMTKAKYGKANADSHEAALVRLRDGPRGLDAKVLEILHPALKAFGLSKERGGGNSQPVVEKKKVCRGTRCPKGNSGPNKGKQLDFSRSRHKDAVAIISNKGRGGNLTAKQLNKKKAKGKNSKGAADKMEVESD